MDLTRSLSRDRMTADLADMMVIEQAVGILLVVRSVDPARARLLLEAEAARLDLDLTRVATAVVCRPTDRSLADIGGAAAWPPHRPVEADP